MEALESVRKVVVVAAPPERAFALFTEGIGAWWPLATHSINGEQTATAVVEGGEGGRLYEVARDGGEAVWGRVLAWEPPHRLAFTWEVTGAPTRVEVRFAAEGDGTRVELEHGSWEALGERADAVRGNYDGGWDTVLGRYVDAV